jgi:hypothetical protein
MVSEITVDSIDDTFPIAGKDNDSQGFRDNFSSIKQNFQTAKGEIDDLQANSVRTDKSNNLNDNNIVAANFSSCTTAVYNGGTVSGTVLASFQDGSYHRYRASGSLSLRITGFPNNNLDDRLTKMMFEVYGDGYTAAISSVARQTNLVTITTSAAHGFATGNSITITLTTNTTLNGTYTITVASPTQFTYTLNGNNLSNIADTGSCLANRTVTFTLVSGGVYKLAPGTTNPIVVSSSVNPYIFEAWTSDFGSTVFLRSLGQFA